MIAGSHVQAGATATDLLGGLTFGASTPTLRPQSRSSTPARLPHSEDTTLDLSDPVNLENVRFLLKK